MKKLLRILLTASIVAASLLQAIPVYASTLYENYYNTDEWGAAIYGAEPAATAQTFTPSTTHTLTSVQLRTSKGGTPTGNAVVYIYATSGGVPTGAALDTATITVASIPAGYSWTEWTLTGGIELTAGTKYAVRITVSGGDGWNYVLWGGGGCGTGTYSGGNYCYNDGTWHELNGYDLGFREYGDIVVTNPVLTISSASNIANTTARLNSSVNDDGGEDCQVRFGYGTTNVTAANFTGYDTITAWVGGYSTGTSPYVSASGLTANTTYYYRAQILNSSGNMTTVDSATFTTTNTIGLVSSLRAYQDNDDIDLSWTKADGADAYMLRYSTTSYPADNASGTLIYNGSGLLASLSSVTGGINYYFAIWGYSSDNWSASASTVMLTTTSTTAEHDAEIAAPSEPDNWFVTTDYTNLSKIAYVYDTVNWIGDAVGMPLNWFWFSLAIVLSIVFAVAVAMITRHGTAGIVAFIVSLVLWSVAQIVPAAVSFVSGLVLGGFILFQRT